VGEEKTELGQEKVELGQVKVELDQAKVEPGKEKVELDQGKVEVGQFSASTFDQIGLYSLFAWSSVAPRVHPDANETTRMDSRPVTALHPARRHPTTRSLEPRWRGTQTNSDTAFVAQSVLP